MPLWPCTTCIVVLFLFVCFFFTNTPSTQLSELFVPMPIQQSSYCPVLLHWYVSLSFPLLLILSLFLSISRWCWVCCHGDTHLSTVWVCDVLLMRQCDCVPETSILPAKQHTHIHRHIYSHTHIVFASHAEQLTSVTSAGQRAYTHKHTYMLSHCLLLICWTAHTYERERAHT